MTLASVHWHDIVDFSDYGALLSLTWKSVLAALYREPHQKPSFHQSLLSGLASVGAVSALALVKFWSG